MPFMIDMFNYLLAFSAAVLRNLLTAYKFFTLSKVVLSNLDASCVSVLIPLNLTAFWNVAILFEQKVAFQTPSLQSSLTHENPEELGLLKEFHTFIDLCAQSSNVIPDKLYCSR